jgi:lipopolysaccharide transport system permease protein
MTAIDVEAEASVATSTDPGDGRPTFVIEATHGVTRIDFAELWHFRDLLYFLTWREISVRYKQTALGIAWAVIQPLATMLVFTVFLGRLAKMPSDGIPYPIFSYLGLLPWMYFANAVTRSSASLVGNSNLLSKVYFPRLLIPLSGTLSALADFAIAFGILGLLMLWYGIIPAATAWVLLPLSLLMTLAAFGVGTFFAALNVRYRDVQHAIPFVMQIWMYATPVVYPSSVVPARWKLAFALNPLAGLIEAYRAAVLGRPIDWASLGVSTVVIVAALAFGLLQFRRLEREFADIV